MADKVLGQTGLDKLIQLIKSALSTKVDKETGKGLSTNDFTTDEKNKLAVAMIYKGTKSTIAGLPNSGNTQGDVWHVSEDDGEYIWTGSAWEMIGSVAEETIVQSDWDQSDTTADDYIKNKPTGLSDFTNDGNFVTDANYVHTDSNYTTAEKNKLADIAAGAEVNVQSDWSQTTTTADDFIKNKPTNVSDFTNDSGFQTQQQVADAIASAIAGVYTPKGTVTFTSLPAAAASNVGWVYNVSDAFTTTASFVEGAGASYPAGTNVVCVSTGANTYAWDCLAGTFDFEEMTANEVQTLWNGNA